MHNELKTYLDCLVVKYNTTEFINNDPVQFLHHPYNDIRDIEIVALLVATISWGNRPQILSSCRKLTQLLGACPYHFICSEHPELDPKGNIHRTFFNSDLIYFCRGLRHIYAHYDSLEDLFVTAPSIWDGILTFRNLMAEGNGNTFSKHLAAPIGNSHKGGAACKRIHLMLRWLCRTDGIVDLGVWHRLSPAQLFIPLDVHVAEVGRQLGLIKRKSNDRKTAEELTAMLRLLDSEDPIKYDFALFGAGEAAESIPNFAPLLAFPDI